MKRALMLAGAMLALIGVAQASPFWSGISSVCSSWTLWVIAALAYILIIMAKGHTPCYYASIAFAWLEAYQGACIYALLRALQSFKENLPVQEREVRAALMSRGKEMQ